ncbi:MAG: DEAD/DEAH box helicase [Desulfomonile tiedjei]|uniref:DEAD/DEAH box helicase n=1 Tax=Desulfomonile tiedjei TaxID=2358 RepID=A0A9D6V4I9_9BACT|nr:DEAD/DEAH box helicase [Desulfomonile tiedjei]
MRAIRNKTGNTLQNKKRSQFPKKPKKLAVAADRIPRVHSGALALLADIGKPEPAAFIPDPFQVQALKLILSEDVVVSAPTGSGKTWIALEAIKEYLAKGCGVWYATPLKALSNAKYEEFGEALGRERVGILTGDRKENADAPVIVGTTEILRNQLYDAMDSGTDLGVDLVILDEAHYLGDIDRGVVWEEVLIYLPDRVRVLLLSATISNAQDVSRWLMHIRKFKCSVVHSAVRPVPLHVLFMTHQGLLTPFFRGRRLFSKVESYAKVEKNRKRIGGNPLPDMNRVIEVLREFQLLPAIVFLKSRSDCDRSLHTLAPSPRSPEEGGFQESVDAELMPAPELKGQRQLEQLLSCRAGAHHAGQLPGWRLLIEKMMVAGHLEVIFSTSTVAAGVNFPARTVVLLQSDRFNGRTFIDMTSTDLHQMTGRAGRRGIDNAGFTLIVPGKYMDIPLVRDLLLSESEPLQSRIAVNFSMILNLLLSHDPDGVRELLGYSFAAFHVNPRKAEKVKRRLQNDFERHLRVLQELDYVDKAGAPTHDGRWAARLRLDHPLLIAELIRQREFSGLNPQELASLIAPFVLDKDKEIVISKELWDRTRPLWNKFRNMLNKLKPLAQFMISRRFEVPNTMFWPVAAVFLWAHEVDWLELIEDVDADEGDLAMLVLRTADHLRQFLSLEKEEPELAETAAKALSTLMRSPLV